MHGKCLVYLNMAYNRCSRNLNCYCLSLSPLPRPPPPTMATVFATTIILTTIPLRKIRKLNPQDRLFPEVINLLNNSGRIKPLSFDHTWNSSYLEHFHSSSLYLNPSPHPGLSLAISFMGPPEASDISQSLVLPPSLNFSTTL